MSCGIYLIKNKINNKSYIGQSVNIKKRWREHIFAANHPEYKDHKDPIHLAIAKYGKENFDFTILEECPKEQLNEKEIYWIDKYNTYQKGYNATIGGHQDFRHIGQPVEVYDLEGNYITTYDNITIAAEHIGVSRNTLYNILYRDRLSTKGYQLKLKNDKNTVITKYQNNQGGGIPVLQIDKNNGNILQKFKSATEAGRVLNIDASSITKVCKGKLKTCGGFIWRYANED